MTKVTVEKSTIDVSILQSAYERFTVWDSSWKAARDGAMKKAKIQFRSKGWMWRLWNSWSDVPSYKNFRDKNKAAFDNWCYRSYTVSWEVKALIDSLNSRHLDVDCFTFELSVYNKIVEFLSQDYIMPVGDES